MCNYLIKSEEMKMLRSKAVLSAVLMAFFMSGIMSCAIELVHSSSDAHILDIVLSWSISFVIALPSVFLIRPFVNALTERYSIEPGNSFHKSSRN